MGEVIKATGISKDFGKNRALNNITFSVDESEIFGFIGPDGSGKTTLFRIITTLLLPDRGDIKVLGLDCITEYKILRDKIGYMPGRFSLYQDLTVEENLRFYATVFGTSIEKNYDLISDIYSHIEPFKKRLAGKLSGGMKQKLALSCALIHKPKLLVLDEPTTGVDAVSRTEFWDMLAKLRGYGITIIVSTPYMDEAIRCDRVALIQEGSLLAVETPKRIRDGFSRKLFRVRSSQKYKTLKILRQYKDTLTAYPFGESIHVTFTNNRADSTLVNLFKKEGVNDVTLEETEANIEDRFLELMNKED